MVGVSPAVAAGRTANTITTNGNAKIARGQSKSGGASAIFDGTGDYLTVPYNQILNKWNATSYTLEYWIRFSDLNKLSYSDEGVVIPNAVGNGNAVLTQTYWSFGPISTGVVRMFYYNGGSFITVSTTGVTLSIDTWYHLAMVHNSGTIKIYVDGTERASASVSGTPNFTDIGNTPLNIGHTGTNGFTGYMDEIRVSSSVRYTTTFTPSATFTNDENTLLLLHCDGDNNTTVFTDDVGVRVPLTPNNIFGGEIDTSQFKFGTASWWQSAEYFGYNYADITQLASIGTGDFTIECWVRRQDNPTATKAHICTVTDVYGIYYDETNSSFRLNTSSGETDRITGGSISLNTWTHLAVVRSSGVIKLYINGTQTGSNYSDTQNLNTAVGFLIGTSRDGDRSWVGWIDEFRFSKTARYTANFTAPTEAFTNDSNTILLTHFNAADASKIITDDNA
jgi:hypothetical protein